MRTQFHKPIRVWGLWGLVGLWALCGLWGGGAWVCPAVAQGPVFDFGQKPQSAVPKSAIDNQIGAMKSGIEALDEKIKTYDDDQVDWKIAARAAIRVRRITLAMLSPVDDKPGTSMMAIYGMILSNHIQSFDELFKKLPLAAQELSQNSDATIEELIRVDRLRRAIKRFITGGISAADASDPGATAAMDPREFAAKQFSPLLGALEPAGFSPGASTWLGAGSAAAMAGPESAQLDALSQRLGAMKLDPGVLKTIAEIMGFLKVGNDYADLKPRVAVVYRLLQGVGDAMAAVEQAAWISDQARQVLQLELENGLTDYQDRTKRAAATQRLERLSDLTSLIGALEQLKAAEAKVESLEQLLVASIIQLRADGGESWDASMHWLGEVTRAMTARRALPDGGVAKIIERIAIQMQSDYQTAEQNVLDYAGNLAGSPADVGQPDSDVALIGLWDAQAALSHVLLHEKRGETLKRFPAAVRTAIQRQMARSLALMLSSEKRGTSVAMMDQFADQLRRIETLPGEATLTKLSATITDDAALGATPADVVKALGKQKVAWATAWSKGTDPGEIEADVIALELTTRAAAGLLVLSQSKDAGKALNRWAGWQADKGTSDALLTKALAPQVQLVVAMLDSGQMGDVHITLNEIRDSVPFAMLALLAASEIGDGLEKLPDDVSVVISQLVYMPDSESFLGSMHFELALISRCVNEYSKAKIDDDQPALKSIREHGSWAVGRIAEHLRRAKPN